MNGILPLTTTVDSHFPMFDHPDDDRLLWCGHFDGHDVYRRADENTYVLVYASDPVAVFPVGWAMAAHWLSRNPDMGEWGSMRAVVRGRKALLERLFSLKQLLDRIVEHHPDDTSLGAVICDACGNAAELVEILRNGVSS